MKLITPRRFMALSFSAMILLVSCKKGDTGPAGAQGPIGAQGPTGAQGPAGTPAEVKYSPWVTTTSTSWVDGLDPNAGGYNNPYTATAIYTMPAPGITQNILSNGIVLAYMRNWVMNHGHPGSANETVQLPYLENIGAKDYYDYVANIGSIKFLYKSDFPWGISSLTGIAFRYVTITGTVASGRGGNGSVTYSGYTADQLKVMSYSEVAELFNLPAEGGTIE